MSLHDRAIDSLDLLSNLSVADVHQVYLFAYFECMHSFGCWGCKAGTCSTSDKLWSAQLYSLHIDPGPFLVEFDTCATSFEHPGAAENA